MMTPVHLSNNSSSNNNNVSHWRTTRPSTTAAARVVRCQRSWNRRQDLPWTIAATRHFVLLSILLVLWSSSSGNNGIVFANAKKISSSLPIDLPSDKKYAYVTLLYSDTFLLGVRTLGQSLRDQRNDQRTNIDHLVMVTPRVGHSTQRVLEDEGWNVMRVEEATNPNAQFDARLHGVYTKLEIFRLTQYHRVVYLDADTTLLENVDELFLCGPFCAVMRHSELINTGVIVAEPSHALYTDLNQKVGMGLYSYTGGDQGFLNSYYNDYAACPYFEPMKQIGLGSDGSKCRRLPHRYNGDWPIAMLNGKLEMVRTKNSMQEEFGEFRRSRIFHYTVGPFKPWDWYAPAIFPFTYHWTKTAQKLEPTLQDKKQVRREVFWIVLGAVYFMFWFLVILHGGRSSSSYYHHPSANSNNILLHHHRSHHNHPHHHNTAIVGMNPIKLIFSILRKQMTPRNTAMMSLHSWSRDPLSKGSLALHLLVGYGCLILGIGMGLKMVPSQTHNPIRGFSIALIWTFGFFFSSYSLYIYRWYLQGEAHSTTKSPKSANVELEQNPLLKPSSHVLSLPSSPAASSSLRNSSNNNTINMHSTTTSSSSKMQASRRESFTYAGGLVVFVVWFVMARIHAETVSLGQVLPPLIGMVLTLIVALTIVFYRLPLLWYQEGLSV